MLKQLLARFLLLLPFLGIGEVVSEHFTYLDLGNWSNGYHITLESQSKNNLFLEEIEEKTESKNSFEQEDGSSGPLDVDPKKPFNALYQESYAAGFKVVFYFFQLPLFIKYCNIRI